MDYRTEFRIPPGNHVRLAEFDPARTAKHVDKQSAHKEIAKLQQRMDALQFAMYAEHRRSLLIVLQAPDAGGKDGVIRHVIAAMNPQGCRVVGFKQPSQEELDHDFLWRVERESPRHGEVVLFNRSHYEDVLVVRVHQLVPEDVWSARYDMINEYEHRLAANGTQVMKLFLHISKEEQLERFRDRLDDPARQWKISEADYSERKLWGEYEVAYEEALSKCSTEHAPWYVIPSDHKWFRDLAVATIVVETMEELGIKVPEPTVDIEQIRRKYHLAECKARPDKG